MSRYGQDHGGSQSYARGPGQLPHSRATAAVSAEDRKENYSSEARKVTTEAAAECSEEHQSTSLNLYLYLDFAVSLLVI